MMCHQSGFYLLILPSEVWLPYTTNTAQNGKHEVDVFDICSANAANKDHELTFHAKFRVPDYALDFTDYCIT